MGWGGVCIKGSLKDPSFQKLDFEWKSEAGTVQSSRPVFCQGSHLIKLKVHILLLIAEPVPFCKKPTASQKSNRIIVAQVYAFFC